MHLKYKTTALGKRTLKNQTQSNTQGRKTQCLFQQLISMFLLLGATGPVESTQRTLVAIKSLEIFSQGGQPAEAGILSCRGAHEVCVRSEISRCGIWPGQRGQRAYAFSRSRR